MPEGGADMVRRFAGRYLAELKEAASRIPVEDFEKVVNALMEAYEGGQSIFIMGNGGSASTASHFACDINKGVCFGIKKRTKVFCLSDNIPTMLAYANDLSYDDIFVEQLRNFLEPADMVIGISGSGNSPNVLKAIEYANGAGAVSVGFTGFDGGRLARTARMSIVVPANDMQKVEDIHLILTHMIMQFLFKTLNGRHA
jgi:D-sedoheptulose 7-phosphate isomerase